MQIENLIDVNAAYQLLAMEMTQSETLSVEHIKKLDRLIASAKQLSVHDDLESAKHKTVGVLMFVQQELKKAIMGAQ